jgi:hypothetical protein
MFSSDQRAIAAYHHRNAPSPGLFRAAARASERLRANRFNAILSRADVSRRTSNLNRMLRTAHVRRGFAPAIVSRGEKKTIDTGYATYVCDNVGTVNVLNGVANGTSAVTRIGDRVTMVSIQLRGFIGPVDDTTADSMCRVMLVYDKSSNGGALPSITDILKDSNSASFNNLDNRRRFSVIRDIKVAVGKSVNTATQAISNSPNIYPVDVYTKVNLPVIYGGAGGAIGDIQEGSLLLVTIGSTNPNAGGSFNGTARIRFTDA